MKGTACLKAWGWGEGLVNKCLLNFCIAELCPGHVEVWSLPLRTEPSGEVGKLHSMMLIKTQYNHACHTVGPR